MTAEVALLNMSAVVLAADSAVTVSRGGAQKIFNTTNKIYQISFKNPLALMIFGRADYMGLPIEVVAKEFRRAHGDKSYETVEKCSEAFLEFLKNEIACERRHDFENFEVFVRRHLDQLSSDLGRKVVKSYHEGNSISQGNLNRILMSAIDEKLASLPKTRRLPLETDYTATIANVAQNTFNPTFKVSQANITKITSLIKRLIVSDQLSPSPMGMVFAGYGESELCPSLVQLNLDGLVAKHFKYAKIMNLDLGREHSDRAAVLGFAQQDVVHSFVNGVTKEIRDHAKALIKTAVEKAGNWTSTTTPVQQQLKSALVTEFEKFIGDRYTMDLIQMVGSMPKQELATLAESLIEITGLRRRVTSAMETVGGDVDVAVISKSEGLVWVKRKHYFPPELNHRFVRRGQDA